VRELLRPFPQHNLSLFPTRELSAPASQPVFPRVCPRVKARYPLSTGYYDMPLCGNPRFVASREPPPHIQAPLSSDAPGAVAPAAPPLIFPPEWSLDELREWRPSPLLPDVDDTCEPARPHSVCLPPLDDHAPHTPLATPAASVARDPPADAAPVRVLPDHWTPGAAVLDVHGRRVGTIVDENDARSDASADADWPGPPAAAAAAAPPPVPVAQLVPAHPAPAPGAREPAGAPALRGSEAEDFELQLALASSLSLVESASHPRAPSPPRPPPPPKTEDEDELFRRALEESRRSAAAAAAAAKAKAKEEEEERELREVLQLSAALERSRRDSARPAPAPPAGAACGWVSFGGERGGEAEAGGNGSKGGEAPPYSKGGWVSFASQEDGGLARAPQGGQAQAARDQAARDALLTAHERAAAVRVPGQAPPRAGAGRRAGRGGR
jgi:hypothetical protein